MERKPMKKTNKKIDVQFKKGKQIGVMFTDAEYVLITREAKNLRMGRGQFIAHFILRLYAFLDSENKEVKL